MTLNVSRRSLLALGAGLGASAMLGGSALARAPKLQTVIKSVSAKQRPRRPDQ